MSAYTALICCPELLACSAMVEGYARDFEDFGVAYGEAYPGRKASDVASLGALTCAVGDAGFVASASAGAGMRLSARRCNR